MWHDIIFHISLCLSDTILVTCSTDILRVILNFTPTQIYFEYKILIHHRSWLRRNIDKAHRAQKQQSKLQEDIARLTNELQQMTGVNKHVKYMSLFYV